MPTNAVTSSAVATALRRRELGGNNAEAPRHSEAATTFRKWLFVRFRGWIFILVFKNV
jgi:hypothetical protein